MDDACFSDDINLGRIWIPRRYFVVVREALQTTAHRLRKFEWFPRTIRVRLLTLWFHGEVLLEGSSELRQ